MKIKRKELFLLQKAFVAVKDLKGIKFAYAIAKNNKLINSEIETLQEIIKPDEKYGEYDQKRIELCEKFCEKDENGKPKKIDIRNRENKIIGYNYVGLESNSEFKEKLKVFMKENKEIIDSQKEKEKEYNKLLDEKVDINIYKIKLEDIDENITPAQMDGIVLLINEDK